MPKATCSMDQCDWPPKFRGLCESHWHAALRLAELEESDGFAVEPRRTPRRKPASEPTSVYRLFDADDRLLYVGITNRGFHRLHQHSKDKAWWPQVTRATFEHLPNRDAALQCEATAITREKPVHNILVPPVDEREMPVRLRTLDEGLVRAQGDITLYGSLLDRDEVLRLLGRQTKKHFGMSADEFLAAFRAGEIARDDERLRYVGNLLSQIEA